MYKSVADLLHMFVVGLAEMKVVASYLLAVLGGNTTPSADDLKHILGSGTPFLSDSFTSDFYDRQIIRVSHVYVCKKSLCVLNLCV